MSEKPRSTPPPFDLLAEYRKHPEGLLKLKRHAEAYMDAHPEKFSKRQERELVTR